MLVSISLKSPSIIQKRLNISRILTTEVGPPSAIPLRVCRNEETCRENKEKETIKREQVSVEMVNQRAESRTRQM